MLYDRVRPAKGNRKMQWIGVGFVLIFSIKVSPNFKRNMLSGSTADAENFLSKKVLAGGYSMLAGEEGENVLSSGDLEGLVACMGQSWCPPAGAEDQVSGHR